MKQYRVAIIGTGRIARFHAAGYKLHPRCEIVALADVKREAAEKFNEAQGLSAKIYTDYAEMLAAEKPDIVSVCLWPVLHLAAVQACVAAGVPAVHCEKPIAASWGECLDIAAAVQGSRTQLTFNHQRRFSPSYVRAKQLLDEDYIGQLERMEVYVHVNLLEFGTHVMDLMMMLNGQSPAKWVMGQVDARRVEAWFGFPFEFAACGEIRFENGVRAVLHEGDDCGRPLFGFRLIGTKGMIDLHCENEIRAMQFGRGEWEVPSPGSFEDTANGTGMVACVDDVIGGLESGRPPQSGVTNAMQESELIFAIYESSLRRARIDLPLTTREASFAAVLEAMKNG